MAFYPPFYPPFVDAVLEKCNVSAPAHDSVLYCLQTCLARSRATCVSMLNWGSTRAPMRNRGQLV